MTQIAEHLLRAKEAVARCQTLALFTEDPPRICRTFLSPPMRACHRQIEDWMRPLGMTVTVDAARNLHGLYPGTRGADRRLLIGSHLDTVPDAGAYDGVLGVVLAISLLESLKGHRLPFALEIIGFSEEEGVRFGVPFIGSRALVGRLDEELLSRRDSNSVSVREAIQSYGLKPSGIPAANLQEGVLGYLEFHIEQGPVLEHRDDLVFTGVASHAGTTPMALRRDALVAAAEWALAVEKDAREIPGLVATVGVLEAKPGATNVIAGECRATLDVRHESDATRTQGVSAFLRNATEIANRRDIKLTSSTKSAQTATQTDPFLVREIDSAVSQAGIKSHRMVSGAGHDAMILAEKVPSAMIFLRSPGGISHNPKESVLVEDVAKAIECGLYLLNHLSSSPEFQTRAHRA